MTADRWHPGDTDTGSGRLVTSTTVATSGLMTIGVLGAALPMLRRGLVLPIRLAHAVMLLVMVAMMVGGMATWVSLGAMAVLSPIAMVLSGERFARPHRAPCVTDLTAMATMSAVMFVSHPGSPGHDAHTTPSAPGVWTVVLAIEVCWAAMVARQAWASGHDRIAVAGSALMIVGMAPMALPVWV